jgi:hypothetical protein
MPGKLVLAVVVVVAVVVVMVVCVCELRVIYYKILDLAFFLLIMLLAHNTWKNK